MRETAQEMLAKAQFAFATERYDFVIELCEKIVELNPAFIGAIVLLGNTHLVQNQYKNAEACFVNAIAIEPEVGEHYFGLGNSLFGQQRLVEAMQQYAKAIQLGCRDEVMQKIYYVVGVINQLNGKNAEALMNFDKSDAIARNNQDQTDILLKRIQIYVEQNNYEKAENCALQLKLLLPDVFKNYQLLFQLYLEQKKFTEAVATLDEAEHSCENTPDTITEILFARAMLFCHMAENFEDEHSKYYNEALGILEQIDNISGLKSADKCEAVITRADIYLKLGLIDYAQQLSETVSDLTLPELREYVDHANYTLVRCRSNKNDYYGVQKFALKLKESGNLFYRHYAYYAEAYAGKQLAGGTPGNLAKYVDLYNHAIAYYRNCTASVPGDFLAYLLRAKCYVDIGKFEKAAEIGRILPVDSQKELQEYIREEKRRWDN